MSGFSSQSKYEILCKSQPALISRISLSKSLSVLTPSLSKWDGPSHSIPSVISFFLATKSIKYPAKIIGIEKNRDRKSGINTKANGIKNLKELSKVSE